MNANQSDFDPYVVVLSHERNPTIHPGDLEFDFQGGIMESLQLSPMRSSQGRNESKTHWLFIRRLLFFYFIKIRILKGVKSFKCVII